MVFGPITVGDILDLIDDCIERAEERAEEFDGPQEEFVIELANRLNSLANHFKRSPQTELAQRFPHVPDETLMDPAGAHEGAPFPMGMSPVHPAVGARLDEIMKPHDLERFRMPSGNEVRGLAEMEYELRSNSESPIFVGGTPMTGQVLGARIPPPGRVSSGEVEEAGADEEER